jgi:hypothetical protein
MGVSTLNSVPSSEVMLVGDLIVRRAAPTYMCCVNAAGSQISPTLIDISFVFLSMQSDSELRNMKKVVAVQMFYFLFPATDLHGPINVTP